LEYITSITNYKTNLRQYGNNTTTTTTFVFDLPDHISRELKLKQDSLKAFHLGWLDLTL